MGWRRRHQHEAAMSFECSLFFLGHCFLYCLQNSLTFLLHFRNLRWSHCSWRYHLLLPAEGAGRARVCCNSIGWKYRWELHFLNGSVSSSWLVVKRKWFLTILNFHFIFLSSLLISKKKLKKSLLPSGSPCLARVNEEMILGEDKAGKDGNGRGARDVCWGRQNLFSVSSESTHTRVSGDSLAHICYAWYVAISVRISPLLYFFLTI